jgi:DNA-binding Lrp family transcriptional regulator
MASKKWKVDMKDIRNLLALVAKGNYSNREIATSLGISHQSVSRHLDKFAKAGVGIQEACDLDDEALAAICYPISPGPKSNAAVMPNLDAILTELAKPNPPTRKVLYDEYCEQFPEESYGYSQFCEFIRQAKKDSNLTMHLEHVPGDQLLIDFAGDKVGIYSSPGASDPDYQASIFVATLAYSPKDIYLGDQISRCFMCDRCNRKGSLLLWRCCWPISSRQYGSSGNYRQRS